MSSTPQIQADTVRRAVSSTGSCSPATIDLLKQLLFDDEPQSTTRPPAGGKGKASSSAKATSLQKSRATTKTRVKVTVFEAPEIRSACLAPSEKVRLATDVVNTTLKALTEALKTPLQPQPATPGKDVSSLASATPKAKALSRSASTLQNALQPRALNRVTSSPTRCRGLRRSSSTQSILASPSLYVAECSRLGFLFLRQTQTVKTTNIQMDPIQLATGISALVGKLLGLGLNDLALKEIRALRNQLQILSKDGKSGPCQPNGKKQALQSKEKEDLASLLKIDTTNRPAPVIRLVIAMQLHIVKLLASCKQGAVVAKAFDRLDITFPDSPASLIVKFVQPTQPTKAAQQLNTLSQLCLSLCPSVSTAEDNIAMNASVSVPPEAALKIQQLALRLRALWWNLSGHEGDLTQGILDPFSRCLSAFSRRCTLQPQRKYEIALELYKGLQSFFEAAEPRLNEVKNSSQRARTSPTLTCFRVLASLSEQASMNTESIQWSKAALTYVDHTSVTSHVLTTRIASLLLRQCSTKAIDDEIIKIIGSTCDSLKESLRGDSSELDELAREVSILRKAAVGFLETSCDEDDRRAFAVQNLCESAVFASVRFITRYLGSPPADTSDIKGSLRHAQRISFIEEAGLKAVDSAVMLSKRLVSTKRITWDLLDSAMQDCLAFTKSLRDSSAPEAGGSRKKGNATTVIVKISHIYWAHFLCQRQHQPNLNNHGLLRALERSVSTAQLLMVEHRQTALLTIKLERISGVYQSLERWENALNSLSMCAQEHINLGVLKQASQTPETTWTRRSWETNDELATLERVLVTFSKVSMRIGRASQEPLCFFDNVDLDDKERILILERQLEILVDLGNSQWDSGSLIPSLEEICRRLDDLLDDGQHPIRTMRFHAVVIRLSSSHPSDFSEDIAKRIIEKANSQTPMHGYGQDQMLEGYHDHVKASLDFSLAMSESHVSVEKLNGPLSAWSSIMAASESYSHLLKRVDDPPFLLSQLQSVTDFMEAKGLETQRVAVLKLIADICKLQGFPKPNQQVLALVALGLQYLRLGYSGKGQAVLEEARRFLDHSDITANTALEWNLAHAESLLGRDDLDQCISCLEVCGSLATKSSVVSRSSDSSHTTSGRVELNRLMSRANHLYSRVALRMGALGEALALAKNSVRLSHRAWASLEVEGRKSLRTRTAVDPDDGVSELAKEMSEMTTETIPRSASLRTDHESLAGPRFWTLVPELHRSLHNIAELFSHQGMFQEAIYYIDQAKRIVEAVEARPLWTHYLAISADYWHRSGQIEKGKELLVQAKGIEPRGLLSKWSVTLYRVLASSSALEGKFEDQNNHCFKAEEMLREIMSAGYIEKLDRLLPSPARGLDEQMQQLCIQETKTKRVQVKGRAKPSASRTKQPAKGSRTVRAESSDCVIEEHFELDGIRGDLLRNKASSTLLRDQLELAESLLSEASNYVLGQTGNVLQLVGLAQHLVHQGLEEMSGDAVFCVLQDSSVSIPFSNGALKKGAKTSLIVSPNKSVALSTSRVAVAKLPAKRGARAKSPVKESFVNTLLRARENILGALSLALYLSSTGTLHSLSSTLTKVCTLLSATALTSAESFIHPMMPIYSLEMAKTVAMRRQNTTLQVEKQNISREELLAWPQSPAVGSSRTMQDVYPLDLGNFKSDFVDILPPKWTVISVSLGERQDELFISKIQSERSPFLLRLPFSRHNSRDADEDVFDFEQGREELLDIIEQANSSTHGARDMTKKGVKAQWWAEREDLDTRLKDLLFNIENIWLGGFKGVFSQGDSHPKLLARFQCSFQNILNKHLPSRQKAEKKAKSSPLNLDPRILELFVGLGDPAQKGDVDEMLTDLLYFVVDILQFHGERNAYDEIEFDSMIVETQDALKSYHQAADEESTGDSNHIILILDKSLHSFPWESLPCLQGRSVSRMPSLGCLRDRIISEQQRTAGDDACEFTVDRKKGAYVLNPSGDLTATQASFEEPLKSLKSWGSIVKREPTESEFKAALESQDLLLYFGHGSGAQYIRAKTIKLLSQCAVALLMGCSSGALTEAGEFEPYGTPMNYMQAGCPALVATLWDVTDKDIDRFSHHLLKDWGLFPSDAVKAPFTLSQARKGDSNRRTKSTLQSSSMASSASPEAPSVSLVEAVSAARDSCVLRYLNGAAPVVYGVPVYLA
ncbi:MAG: hypothetical protein M4579_004233 [Chaenotheca gracillima]|nr:MAG: hypothetical protein M4579_004233 [Chaenotheca gracillima]